MEIEPDDPAEAEKEPARHAALMALYPRDRAREMVKAYLDALPVDDAVFLPDTSPEELEAEMASLDEGLQDAEPGIQDEVEAMKQLFRDVRGKRLSELPPLTPEEAAEELDGETETAIAQLMSSWFNMLWVARERAGGAEVPLTDGLEAIPPVTVGAFGDAEDGGTPWLEAVCAGIALSPEQARELQTLWAAALRPLIDAAPDGYILWSDEYVIGKDARGYVLRASPTKP